VDYKKDLENFSCQSCKVLDFFS